MGFRLKSKNEALADQLILDYREAELTDADRALCDYAVKLTLTPGAMNEKDLQALRDNGFSDEQILIATQVAGYFNYINRMADALGVDAEDWMELSREEWQKRKGTNYG